jgi:glutathione synthase/RimK-type ligase-like ATP-grasp enzyme
VDDDDAGAAPTGSPTSIRGAEPHKVTEASRDLLADLAIGAAETVGAVFCGVDIAVDRDDRHLIVEVNSMPAWAGLQSVSTVSVADAIAEALLSHLDRLETAAGRCAPSSLRQLVKNG